MATRTKTTIKKATHHNYILLNDLFEKYIIEKNAHNISQATEQSYRNSFHKFISFVGGDKTIDSINDEIIFSWISNMKKDGIKIISLNHYLREMRTFLYWCMEKELIQNRFKIKLLTFQEETIKTYTEEEQIAILAKPRKDADFVELRTYTIIGLVMDCGARASTICNLKMKDVDLQTGYITFSHTKNKKSQRVPMSSALIDAVQFYISEWRNYAKPDDYLFCNVGELKLTPSALRLAFGKYCMKRGVLRINKKGELEGKSNIHGLRHTFAKGYLLNNGNTFKLQQILGHSSLEMTRKYITLFGEDIKDGHDDFSPFANAKKGNGLKKTIKRAI